MANQLLSIWTLKSYTSSRVTAAGVWGCICSFLFRTADFIFSRSGLFAFSFATKVGFFALLFFSFSGISTSDKLPLVDNRENSPYIFEVYHREHGTEKLSHRCYRFANNELNCANVSRFPSQKVYPFPLLRDMTWGLCFVKSHYRIAHIRLNNSKHVARRHYKTRGRKILNKYKHCCPCICLYALAPVNPFSV